jgi:alkanesulfonate monooxygenase
MVQRQLKLGAFMRPVSIHTGAWRYPGAWPDANFNFAHIKRLIQKLEAGKFDAFFMADHLAVLNMPISALKRSHTVTSFEAVHAVIGAGQRHRTDRTGRHRFDHVRRALSCCPPLRFARSHLRRPCRMEHRHHVKSGRGAEFRAR